MPIKPDGSGSPEPWYEEVLLKTKPVGRGLQQTAGLFDPMISAFAFHNLSLLIALFDLYFVTKKMFSSRSIFVPFLFTESLQNPYFCRL